MSDQPPRSSHTISPRQRRWFSALASGLLVVLLLITFLREVPAHAAATHAVPSFQVTFNIQNFGGTLLNAASKALSDPAHATFSLTNYSQLWYGLDVQATPSSLRLGAADPADDLLAADFTAIGLLQPTDLIPINLEGNLFKTENLATHFTDTNQQLQVMLDPFDLKAITLDGLGLLLNVLGLSKPEFQTGLFKPDLLKAILTGVEKSQALVAFFNDLISAGHAIVNGEPIKLKTAKLAQDLYDLFSTAASRQFLADILAEVVDGALSESSVAQTVLSFPLTTVLSKAKIAVFFAQYLLAVGVFIYHQAQLPTIALQSTDATPTPESTPITCAQAPGTVHQIMIPNAVATGGITKGPDGNMWFTDQGNLVGRITPAGVVSVFTVPISAGAPTTGNGPDAITTGPDGNLWFTENNADQIGRVTTNGNVTQFNEPHDFAFGAVDIAPGPDGNLWLTNSVGVIGYITPGGATQDYLLPPPAISGAFGITAGPGGMLWFTESNANQIGSSTTSGSVKTYAIPTANSMPQGITAGPDGNLWFTESLADRIGRITPGGSVTEYPVPTGSNPAAITTGPDGNLWFTEPGTNQIGRITPGGTVAQFCGYYESKEPRAIATGPDGNLWIAENTGAIGILTP